VPHACNPRYSGQRSGESWFKASPVRPYLKNTQQKKWAGKVAQVVECLPSNREAPSSNSDTTKKKSGGFLVTLPLAFALKVSISSSVTQSPVQASGDVISYTYWVAEEQAETMLPQSPVCPLCFPKAPDGCIIFWEGLLWGEESLTGFLVPRSPHPSFHPWTPEFSGNYVIYMYNAWQRPQLCRKCSDWQR
jgi:hypothetical protein